MCRKSPVTAGYPAGSLRANAPKPPVKGCEVNMGKETRIAFRLESKEKQSITAKAKKCGLSTTEYVKQRALGYEPKAVPPDALFLLLERIGEMEIKSTSPELNIKIERLLTDIANTLLLPGKDGDSLLQLQDSGQSMET